MYACMVRAYHIQSAFTSNEQFCAYTENESMFWEFSLFSESSKTLGSFCRYCPCNCWIAKDVYPKKNMKEIKEVDLQMSHQPNTCILGRCAYFSCTFTRKCCYFYTDSIYKFISCWEALGLIFYSQRPKYIEWIPLSLNFE